MSFLNESFSNYSWLEVKELIASTSKNEVINYLNINNPTIKDFAALLSPEAHNYLPEMMEKSQYLTQKRFGKTVQMYIPLYLSNECNNICTYCGFSFNNKIKRTTLNDTQIIKELEVIQKDQFQHILLVTGESQTLVGVEYLKNAIELVKNSFDNISIEVQPLEQQEYAYLIESGLNSVLVYQETYHRDEYKKHHPKGKKSNFEYRLDTPDRLGKAGIHKIGLGVLLGLEEWRVDSFFCGLHLDYLEKKYWKTKYSISFPRLRPASGVTADHLYMSDKELIQLICAYRIFKENTELSISTRESELLRNHIFKYGVTAMSAGSKTNPGGYSSTPEALEQFEIDDCRTPTEIEEMIKNQGYEPIWKDWEHFNN